MNKFFAKSVLASAALIAASTSANAYVLYTVSDGTVAGTLSCNTAAEIAVPGTCDSRFTVTNINEVSFGGTFAGYRVVSSGAVRDEGASLSFAQASTTLVERLASANTTTFTIDLVAFDYQLPIGSLKRFSGQASLTTVNPLGGTVQSNFIGDSNNVGGLLANPGGGPGVSQSCIMDILINTSCNGGPSVVWSTPNNNFSLRDFQIFTMSEGEITGTTSLVRVTNRIPEPVSTSLVGAALLGMALLGRRRSVKAAAQA